MDFLPNFKDLVAQSIYYDRTGLYTAGVALVAIFFLIAVPGIIWKFSKIFTFRSVLFCIVTAAVAIACYIY